MTTRMRDLLVIVVAAAAAAIWLNYRSPSSGKLAFNGVSLGDNIADLEKHWGPPDFKNPKARYQQWEHPLTQLHYDEHGVVVEVGGSGTGLLTRGDRPLLRCGLALEKDIVPLFGPPPEPIKENFYRYPGLTIHCGSESQGVRNVSHIQLGQLP